MFSLALNQAETMIQMGNAEIIFQSFHVESKNMQIHVAMLKVVYKTNILYRKKIKVSFKVWSTILCTREKQETFLVHR